MVTELLWYVHLVMFYLIINGELNSLLPSHKAYVNSFVQRGTRASDCIGAVHGVSGPVQGQLLRQGHGGWEPQAHAPEISVSILEIPPTSCDTTASHWLSFHLSHSSKDMIGMQTLVPVSIKGFSDGRCHRIAKSHDSIKAASPAAAHFIWVGEGLTAAVYQF